MREIISVVLLFLCSSVFASDAFVNTVEHTNTETIVVKNSGSAGVAQSLAAAQHHFDFGTYSYQGSLGAAQYNNKTALSFGLAKRMCKDQYKNCVMINGSVGITDGREAVGAGINWRFK